MTTELVFSTLLAASTAVQVEEILDAYFAAHPNQSAWVPFGKRPNNRGVIEVSTDPGRSIIERVTNGIDGVLEGEFEAHDGVPVCRTPKEAAVAWLGDAQKRRAFLGFVNKSLSRAALAGMIHLAKKKVRQAASTDFDQDPWTLNMENGTVDLQTGCLRPHRSEDLLSKMIPFRYDPGAECPHFMAFLYRIMGSHPDAAESDNNAEQMVRYLQKAFGCAATGKPEKLLFVF